MNETLEKETPEELEFVEKYTLTFENNNIPSLENEVESNEIDSENNNNSLDNAGVSEECTSLVEIKEHRLFVIQNMFKKSIRVSLKSFLISLSLSFLNLFI